MTTTSEQTSESTASPFLSTKLVQQLLHEQGFQLVGFTDAEPLLHEAERLNDWLHSGFYATMEWMPRHAEMRLHPKMLWPEARSIAVVGINYFPGVEAGQGSDVRIARYALGKDYHNIIRKRLAKVLKALQLHYPGLKGRPFTDSAPLLEKALAVKAGLGWQGKHSLVINQTLGSWFFVGTLFLDAPLDAYSSPMINQLETGHCGTCTRCIEACPTDALQSATVLNSDACIAYATIEHHGERLPSSVEGKLNQWAFGCDICQEVCPWNIRFATVSQDVAFQPRPQLEHPSQATFLEMDDATFQATFANSPLKRTGLKRIQRNIRNITNE
jgi:epoxyqueuosine reductase